MPTDFSISLDSYLGGKSQDVLRIPEDFGKAQSMKGFESTYRNIIDYIVRITYRIWENRDIEYIGDTYSDASQVFDDYGLQLGNRKIIKDTYHTTGAFSDIELIADDIIWAGNDEVGYHTSHRTIIRGTNDGQSKYGPATGKKVDVLACANCVAKNNVIFLEHVCYNNSSLLQQLGFDLKEKVKELVASPPAGWPRTEEVWHNLKAAASPAKPLYLAEPVEQFDIDQFVREAFFASWGQYSQNQFKAYFHDEVLFTGPTDRTAAGIVQIVSTIENMTGPWEGFRPQIDEVYWMGNNTDGYRASVRWSSIVSHPAASCYGDHAVNDLQVWGLTQYEVKNEEVVREWTLFNELDLMMQIEAFHQGITR